MYCYSYYCYLNISIATIENYYLSAAVKNYYKMLFCKCKMENHYLMVMCTTFM